MASPHPSYPPLEMAYAGLQTITNEFEGKDLSTRSPNIVSISDLSPVAMAAALSRAVRAATPSIGQIVANKPLSDVRCPLTPFDGEALANRLRASWSNTASFADETYPVAAQ